MKYYRFLLPAFLLLSIIGHAQTKLNSFSPGARWPDDKGVHINAHGGGILYNNGVYYWFGEHKVAGNAGNRAMVGVHCYSSGNITECFARSCKRYRKRVYPGAAQGYL